MIIIKSNKFILRPFKRGDESSRIYAYVFSWNKASMKVLEKAGYKLEGILRKDVKKNNKFIDTFLFAKVR